MNWCSFLDQKYSLFKCHCKLFNYKILKNQKKFAPWNPTKALPRSQAAITIALQSLFSLENSISFHKTDVKCFDKYLSCHIIILIHVIYYFYLTKINLSISTPYPKEVNDKQRKKHFSVVICKMSPVKYFSPRMEISSVLWVALKKFSCRQLSWQPLVITILFSQFQENVSIFNFLANALVVIKYILNQ